MAWRLIHARPAVLVCGLTVVWSGLAAILLLPRFHVQDLALYFAASGSVMQRMLPYRDFAFEYPTLALAPMLLPRLYSPHGGESFRTYVWLFLVENAIWVAGLGYCVFRMARRWMPPRQANIVLLRYGVLAIILAPTIGWRFDLFPALVSAGAVIAVLEHFPGVAGSLIGFGVAAKLYPVALVPVLGAWYVAKGAWSAAARFVSASVGVAMAAILPFVFWARDDVFSFLRYHNLRGLEIESVPAGILMLAQLPGHGTMRAVNNFGAIHLQAPAADAVQPFLAPVFVVAIGALAIIAFQCFRSAQERSDTIEPLLIQFALASLMLLLVTNKVFSPQYLGWLLPFAPFLSRTRFMLVVILCALTTALFPYSFTRLMALQTAPILVLNIRNAIAVGLAVLLVTRPSVFHRAQSRVTRFESR